MGGLFGGGAKTPKVPDPPAIPDVGPDAADFAARLTRRRAGFASTLLGDLESMNTGKKRLLGG